MVVENTCRLAALACKDTYMSLKTAFYLGSFLTMLPLSSPLLAQANSVAVENGSSKDVYQQAVDHLGKLGFPSVKGAKYYHLSDHYNDRGRFSSERGSIKIKMTKGIKGPYLSTITPTQMEATALLTA